MSGNSDVRGKWKIFVVTGPIRTTCGEQWNQRSSLLSSTCAYRSLCMNIRYQNSKVRTTYASAWEKRYWNKLDRTVCDNGNDAQGKENVSELVRTSRNKIRLTRFKQIDQPAPLNRRRCQCNRRLSLAAGRSNFQSGAPRNFCSRSLPRTKSKRANSFLPTWSPYGAFEHQCGWK